MFTYMILQLKVKGEINMNSNVVNLILAQHKPDSL